VTASAAVPAKATTAITRHATWPYLVIADPSGDAWTIPRRSPS
jgi:hypothetical protein